MSWTCCTCLFPNEAGSVSCGFCDAPKPRIRSSANPAAEQTTVASSAAQTEAVAASVKQREEENSGHWDAFASLQENYESSDENESDEDSCSEDNQDSNDEAGQWNAFESLENNYQSSSESSSESELEEGGSDQDTTQQECIELLDSSDEERNYDQHGNQTINQHDLLDSDEGREPAPKRRRISKISDHFKSKASKKTKTSKSNSKSKESPIVLDDSSISEDESPPFSGRGRAVPSWQRSVPLHSTTTSVQQSSMSSSQSRKSIPRGSTLPSASFSCMNGRNDVMGGGGSGVNGVSLQAQSEETGSKKRKSRAAAANKAKSTRKSANTKKRASKKATATTDGDDKPKARKRRSYKRKGKRYSASTSRSRSAGANGRSFNNAWSARERGIRNNRNNNSGPSTYMSISKQESALSGIGGATMSF